MSFNDKTSYGDLRGITKHSKETVILLSAAAIPFLCSHDSLEPIDELAIVSHWRTKSNAPTRTSRFNTNFKQLCSIEELRHSAHPVAWMSERA
jgi:hypothetical protein